ncbi:SAM-dependent methyltransferase [Chromobacterium phragmitis]|uniref:SAM-dependent methyltransferase n=1 Tax=Chromobacterium phragmitis TaxID=2202141 RepID=UPI00143D4FFC|nr:class I SAM-dependent methyltransferase [Chromobacterium phragmitis]
METTQYDREEHIFTAFLDPYMKFSSGLFSSHETSFENSVIEMLDFLLDSAQISNGARVLEIGTGWGCLIKRLKERFPHATYTGVSPSAAQITYVREHVDQQAPIHVCAFELAEVQGPFDAIFLSGTFCHLQDKFLQLERIFNLLAEGGRLIIEDSFFRSRQAMEVLRECSARGEVQTAMFGWAELMPLSSLLDISESIGFHLVSCRDFTDDYERTGKEWIRRLAKSALSYPAKKDMLFYLRLANNGWHRNAYCYALTFERPRRVDMPSVLELVNKEA